jgi:uncharacterized membrane protein YoaK (UPF0700 family)
MIAGSADAIGFLGLGGIFVAHITGNLIILAAYLVTGARVHVATVLAVPVFVFALILTRVWVARLEEVGARSLRPLLLLQLVLLAGFLMLAVVGGTRVDPNAATSVLAALFGVSAMGVQNALVQVSLRGAPTTAVMTTDITRLTMDVGEVLLGTDPSAIGVARRRAARTWPAILGFTTGAALGAGLYAGLGLASAVLPVGLAVAALSAAHMTAPRHGASGEVKRRLSAPPT